MKRPAGPAGSDPTQAFDVTDQAARSAEPGYSSATDTMGGAELLEDRTVRIAGGGHGRRFGMSIPGAIAGSFLVVALAFGAAMGPQSALTSDAGHGGETAYDGDKTDSESDAKPDGATAGGFDADKPDGSIDNDSDETDGGEEEEPEKTAAPEATLKPEPTKVPAPAATSIEIDLGLEGTAVVIEWTACETGEFRYYKIIRSKDEAATWPLGAGDTLAAAIESQATTRFVDKAVDGGRTYHYKVVALREWEGQKVIACGSKTAGITTPTPPTPKPEPTDGGDMTMSLSLSIKEGHPFIDWSPCEVDFHYYKVVRSSDSTITWPPGDNDSKVAAVGQGGETKAWDSGAPSGKKVYYRVFCIRETDSGSVAVAATAVKGIETPAGKPAPEPIALGFDVDVTGEGVVLHWQACTSDAFVFYKVVRSTKSDNPSYLPWTEASEVIGVIENAANTQHVDDHVQSGQTISYRVQAIGYWNGEKVLLGQTSAVAVTIP